MGERSSIQVVVDQRGEIKQDFYRRYTTYMEDVMDDLTMKDQIYYLQGYPVIVHGETRERSRVMSSCVASAYIDLFEGYLK